MFLKSNKAPPAPGPCEESLGSKNYDPKWKEVRQYCSRATLGWAIGGDVILDFPDNLGYPIGGSEYDLKYIMLEIHYDNPEAKNGIF